MTYLFLVQLLKILFGVALCVQEFELEPKDLTVHRGSPVNLPCQVKDLAGTLQWTMNGFGLGTDRELEAFPRFRMVGSDNSGNYTLHISAALLVDEAEYQCQVGATDTEKPLRSAIAKLTVLYPPNDDEDQVYINPESLLQTVAGSTVRITCRGGLTKPVSKITWKKGNETLKKGISESIEDLPNSYLKSITSWIDLKPDKSFHKENISCIVSHEALNAPIVRTLTMHVQYAPDATIAKHFVKAYEGDDLTFTCTATGNPPDLRYRWKVNGVAAIGEESPEFTLKDVTRKENKAKVSCIVSNAIGNGKAEEVIDVNYHPVFSEEPQDVDAEEGKEVILKCLVDSNPPAEVVWTNEHSQKVLGHGKEWKLKVNQETKGVYVCRAASPGFQEISRAIEVMVRGRPSVVKDQVSYGSETSTGFIECVVESVPKPTEISWSRNGVRIRPESTVRYDVEVRNFSKGAVSTLLVHDVSSTSFGLYNCTASNQYGSHTQIVEFKRKQALPLVTVLVSIMGSLFLVFIVIVIFVLYKREFGTYKDSEKRGTSVSESSALKSELTSGSESGRSETDLNGHDDEWSTSDTLSAGRLHRSKHSDIYRRSADYSDASFRLKHSKNNEDGYIPYVDYSRDYNPPVSPAPIAYSRNSLYSSVPLNNVDPRFSAAYGNPYLKLPSGPKEFSPNINASQSNNLNNVFQNTKNMLHQNINSLSQSKPLNEQYIMFPPSQEVNAHKYSGTPI